MLQCAAGNASRECVTVVDDLVTFGKDDFMRVVRSLAIHFVLTVISVTAIQTADLLADEKQAQEQKPLFTLSKQTTYLNGPVRKDGTVDYVAALDAIARRGATVENNAAVLLYQAVGPAEILPELRAEYFKRLSIDPLPIQGNYFVTLDQLVQRAVVGRNISEQEFVKLDPLIRRRVFAAQDKVWEQFDEAQDRSWTEREFPLLAEWLLVNQQPLKLLQQAVQRTRYYSPLIAEDKEFPMVSVLLPGLTQYRELARALSIRITMNVSQGKIDEAIADSVTCHRLGRLIGQGPFLVDSLVGIAIDSMACHADVMAAHYGKLPLEKIKGWREQLQKLAPLPSVVERIDGGERLSYLDVTFGIVRFGPSALDQLDEMSGGSEDKKPGFKDVVSKAVLNTMSDWDDVMRRGNRWYDELVVAGRKPTYQQRMTAFVEIDRKLEEAAKSAADPKKLLPLLLARDKGPGKVLSSLLSDILISMMLPSVGQATVAEDRLVMNNRLVDVAFGLAAYRQETRQYPVQLEQLVPKYLAKIPEDLFSGKPVRYRRKGQGYLLYSVGPNQKDNGGQRENQELDDVGFQVPLPQ